jgi:anaerobic magnesium-protoporphyrin IX monomethyl ester cyclase
MKILFIVYDNESAVNILPVGTCYVTSYLKANGYDDITYYSQDIYHYSEEHLTRYLSENHFDIAAIGFVAGYYQHRKVLNICEAINKAGHRPFIVLGGHGPTPEPAFYLKATGADAVVMGEGELPFLNLVRALDSMTPLADVLGIAYREGQDAIVNKREKPVADLDSIPFPLYEPLPMEYYMSKKLYGMTPTDRAIFMVGSRGCNYTCNFCQRLEKGIRFRSPGNLVEEIKKYIRDYQITYVVFFDELFMFNEKRVVELTEAFIKAELNIKYFCTGRLNSVNDNMLDMLKRSGCVYIDYGIEQFDNDALASMRKALTEEEIIRGIELTKAKGFPIIFDIIFGNIGDTRKSLRKTLDFFKKYNDYGQFRTIRPVTPYPGTRLYYHAIEKGLLKGPEDFYAKHVNLELPTVNLTDIPDDEFISLLFEANKEIINDYYEHFRTETIESFRKVYFEKDAGFRGVRH